MQDAESEWPHWKRCTLCCVSCVITAISRQEDVGVEAHPDFCLRAVAKLPSMYERPMEESSSTEAMSTLFSRMKFPKQREKLEMSHLNKCTCSFSTLYLSMGFKLTPAHLEPIKIIMSCSTDYPGCYKCRGIAWEYPNNILEGGLSLHRSTSRSSHL